MKKILIVEDDSGISELERDYLEANDFAVDMTSDGNMGLQKALSEDYALILLDIMLPGKDGFQVCRQVRQHKDTPILLISARREDIDKIRGFGIGLMIILLNLLAPMSL